MWRGILTVMLLTSAAWAQMRIEQGNVLDANPRLGSGGLNYGGRQYQSNMTNRIVTGNAANGTSFRGFSPVRDPSSFFVGGANNSYLPSDSLANFNRDASGQVQRPAGVMGPLPYYAPSSTVAGTGAIVSGLNEPGTSQLRTPYMLPRPDFRAPPPNPLSGMGSQSLGNSLSVSPEIARVDTGNPVSGPVNPRLLSSPLFGGVRLVPADVLAAEAARAATLGPGAPPIAPAETRAGQNAPIDLRVRREANLAAGTNAGQALPPTNEQLPRETGQMRENLLPAQGGAGAAVQAGDVFAHMRTGRLLEPLERAGTLRETARAEAAANNARTAELVRPLAPARPGEAAGQAAATPAQREINAPLRSFVGTEQSAMNRYLAAAEAKLKAGQYYQAANLYDLAHAVDARNPLPLLGQSMALLAAGDYMSSSTNLLQAVQMFEALAQFRIDLKAFVPDMAALDRRRADLERQLEKHEDYRLRFLLGFAEYSSGFEKLGLNDMKKAAAAAPQEWDALRRFTSNLENTQRPSTAPAATPGR